MAKSFFKSRPQVRGLVLSFVVLNFCASAECHAHETWLAPSPFRAAPGEEIQFRLTSGMKFPALEYSIRPERVRNALFRQNKKTHDFGRPISTTTSLQFRQRFFDAGLVTAFIQLHPKTLELSEKKVAEYFEEISASPGVRELWARLKAQHKWRETYTKCAKTFVALGNADADASWKEAVGLPLEIIPMSNPTALHRGDNFTVQLRALDQPLARATIGLIDASGSKRVFQKTDDAGRANFVLPHEGPALFFAVQLVRRDPEWISTFSTISVQVAPEKHSLRHHPAHRFFA